MLGFNNMAQWFYQRGCTLIDNTRRFTTLHEETNGKIGVYFQLLILL